MKKYKLNGAMYGGSGHDSVVLSVSELGEDGLEVRKFKYTLGDSNLDEGLGKLLRKELKDSSLEVKENRMVRIRRGEIPVPDGYELRNNKLIRVDDVKRAVLADVNRLLDNLYSGRSQAMAERDEVFAENRRKQVDLLLHVDQLPGFPENINLAKELERVILGVKTS